ncbi:MAG: hypothetical protein AAFW65_07880 [Pseudomonadota bacterium]
MFDIVSSEQFFTSTRVTIVIVLVFAINLGTRLLWQAARGEKVDVESVPISFWLLWVGFFLAFFNALVVGLVLGGFNGLGNYADMRTG